MSKVFFSIGLSLDGFMAGANRGPSNPLGDGGQQIHEWMFRVKSFREHLSMEGGETGRDNDIVETIFSRAGASILGKRMFEEGEASWPEKAPFGTPVFVLTHQPRDPWVRKGGTTFYFVTDGIESALEKAKQAAGSKDVRISGGADTIRQYLHAGLLDEGEIHLSPLLLGKGLRLFEGIDPQKVKPQVVDAIHSPYVTHLYYRFK